MKSWVELKVEELTKKAERSSFKWAIFYDANYFHKQGYVWDVALQMAVNYYLGR